MEAKVSENKDPLSPESDAEFIGWQKTSTGEAIALYNVTAAQHPLFCSTVSEKTLCTESLKIPETPLPQEQARRSDHER
jgi:hypothetical protein